MKMDPTHFPNIHTNSSCSKMFTAGFITENINNQKEELKTTNWGGNVYKLYVAM